MHARRFLTLISLAAYLAATLAGDLFHVHGPSDPCASGHHHCGGSDHHHHPGHAAHAGSCGHEHGVAGHYSRPCDGQPLHDDDCTVCRFQGQKVLPVALPDAAVSHDRIAELVQAEPPVVLNIFARVFDTRGPPISA